jgi:restriction system protein
VGAIAAGDGYMKRLWLVRAGRQGEREQAALENNALKPGFDGVPDLATAKDRASISSIIAAAHPELKANTVRHFAAQLNQFANTMQSGDLVVMPSKLTPTVFIAEVAGNYKYDPQLRHLRPVIWKAKNVERSAFKQDLLHSFGAFMTICEIKRNNALERVLAVAANGVDPGAIFGHTLPTQNVDEASAEEATIDLEGEANQQTILLIKSEFAGHRLAELVAAILRVDGYTVRVSPPGPDGGRDILAVNGPLGFGDSRICVQVKSGDGAADNTVVLSLQGAMANARARLGLLVSLSGVTTAAQKILDDNFFNIRLWRMTDLLDAIRRTYAQLPDEVRAALPLKQIWIPISPSEE